MLGPLDYAHSNAPKRRTSAMALLALPVGILSFPLLLHWTVLLNAPYSFAGIPADTYLSWIANLWLGCGVLFCIVAAARMHIHRAKLKGAAFAVAGLTISLLWLLLYVIALSLPTVR